MAIGSSKDKLKSANRDTGDIASAMDTYIAMYERDKKEAISKANKRLTPMARDMVMNNLNSSGIQDRSGTLKNAVRRVTAIIYIYKGTPSITVKMPEDVKYPRGSKSNFYAAAASLSYGAVRQKSNFNEREKKKIKRKALKKAKGTEPISAGGVTVIPPRPFWQLSQGQKNALASTALDIFVSEMMRATKKRLR